jgi:hypothetical protein
MMEIGVDEPDLVARDLYEPLHLNGLYALTVVPRAPNFCALRRVSSNAERAYVSTSWPVSIRSKP